MINIIEREIFSQSEFVLRILIACVLGAAIGFERKNRNKGAGMRTHALVCLGAALFMVVSKYGFEDMGSYGYGELAKFDASRIASQVVSGIGFLGAGIIFVRNHSISGVTTAAGIWVTAGVGMCVGAGQYYVSILATVMVIAVQLVLHRISFFAKEPYRMILKLSVKKAEGVVERIEQELMKQKIEICTVKINKDFQKEIKLEFEIILPPGLEKIDFINRISVQEEILGIRG